MRKRKRMKVIKKVLLHHINDMSELNRYTKERMERDIFFFKPENIYFKLSRDIESNCQMCCMEKYCGYLTYDKNHYTNHYLNCLSIDYFEELSEIEVMMLIGE